MENLEAGKKNGMCPPPARGLYAYLLVLLLAVTGWAGTDELLKRGFDAARLGRLENALETFMDVLLDEPENDAARQAIGKVSMKMLEKERAVQDAQRKRILRDAGELQDRRNEKEKRWEMWLEQAENSLQNKPLAAYDLYLRILHEDPDHKQALAGIAILQRSTALEIRSERKISGTREAALKGFYLYCSGDAAGAQGVWSLLLKWGVDKNVPLSNEVIRGYRDMAVSALKAERLIRSELSSRKKRISARTMMGIKAAKDAIKKARMAIWKTNYVKAMKELNLVLESSCTEKAQKRGFRKKRDQAYKLKREIWERFVSERDFRVRNARAHMVRGLVHYSRNKLARAMNEWGTALEWDPDDSLLRGAWQVASALEIGQALARASRTPLQMESIRVNLGKIAKLESDMPPGKARPARPAVKKPPAKPSRAKKRPLKRAITRKDLEKLSRQASADVGRGRYDAAIKKLDRISAYDLPQELEYQREEAIIQRKRIEKSVAERLESNRKKMAHAHYVRGLVYYGSNDLAGARREWKQTVKLYPGHSKAKRSLERVEQEMGRNK